MRSNRFALVACALLALVAGPALADQPAAAVAPAQEVDVQLQAPAADPVLEAVDLVELFAADGETPLNFMSSGEELTSGRYIIFCRSPHRSTCEGCGGGKIRACDYRWCYDSGGYWVERKSCIACGSFC